MGALSLGFAWPALADVTLYPTTAYPSSEFNVKVTRDVAYPETTVVVREGGGLIRTPAQFIGFVGESAESLSVIQGRYVDNPHGQNRPGFEEPADLQLAPNKWCVVGVHLGNKGSQGYSVQITRVERQRRPAGMGPVISVYYKIKNSNNKGKSVKLDTNRPTLDGAQFKQSAALERQRFAPSNFVKLPAQEVPLNSTIRYIDEDAISRLGNMNALRLSVSGAGARNVDLMVTSTGAVIGAKGQATALVDEMFRLYDAIAEAKPAAYAHEQGTEPVRRPGVDNMRDNGTFKMGIWLPSEGRQGNSQPDLLTQGSWEAARDRLEPVRRALQLIQWRLDGKIDVEDIERLEGRLGLTSLQLTVGTEGLNILVDEMGVVTAGKATGTLNPEELDHLAYAIRRTNPLGREPGTPTGNDEPFNAEFEGKPLPEKAELPNVNFVPGSVPGWIGEEFRLIIQDGADRRHFGGYLEASDARTHALYTALELIAARIQHRPARISGTVKMVTDGDTGTTRPVLESHLLTFFIDPLEGGPSAEAVRTKLAEWTGRWVEINARAAITSREGAEAVPTGKIVYPQLGELAGVVQGGLRIQLQEVLSKPTGVSVQLSGNRAGALVGDQAGKWVRIRTYMFYGANYLPEVAYVEALQAIASRRDKVKFGLRPSDQDGLLRFYDRPGGGLVQGSIYVGPETYQVLWVTNRQGNYSYVPIIPNAQGGTPSKGGWAQNDSELLHLSERPQDVDNKSVNGGFFNILRDAASDAVGEVFGTGR